MTPAAMSRTATAAPTMPAITGVPRPGLELSVVLRVVGSTMVICVAAKMVSFSPRSTPGAGFCWQPASRATKSGCVSAWDSGIGLSTLTVGQVVGCALGRHAGEAVLIVGRVHGGAIAGRAVRVGGRVGGVQNAVLQAVLKRPASPAGRTRTRPDVGGVGKGKEAVGSRVSQVVWLRSAVCSDGFWSGRRTQKPHGVALAALGKGAALQAGHAALELGAGGARVAGIWAGDVRVSCVGRVGVRGIEVERVPASRRAGRVWCYLECRGEV